MLLQACRLHPILKALCAHPDISPSYLQRHAKEVDPGFVVGPVPADPVPSNAKTARRTVWCEEWKDRPLVLWWGREFVDSFTEYDNPLPHTAIRRRGSPLTMTEHVGCSGCLKHHMLVAVPQKVPALPAVACYAAKVGICWSQRMNRSWPFQSRDILVPCKPRTKTV